MWKRRPLISSAAIALAFVACTDTPNATDAVDGLAFARGGVVERFTTRDAAFVTDADKGLRATLGFDRVGWCADPGNLTPDDRFRDHPEYLAEHDVQRTLHPNDWITDVRKFEGILVVYDDLGSVRDCTTALIGIGTGDLQFTGVFRFGRNPSAPPDVLKWSFGGLIETVGGTKRVNVHRAQAGLSVDPGISQFNANIIVQP